ncbi:UDP-N-acetylmuramoylalanine/D-glutamate ligase [Parasphaerochaeta coccoides DSM 17374]|uniref:UDP-N-acetylmuramoylalanine/D-glutamate ligase n=2 Tax=Parasphaerochaeta TaxID=3062336 RepID=F4GLF9_PARC1|nr:UDP-N-acetylmuramoylalanine/D-glutamate ligase [Parasphaerochaeta coccoides DSM 17374]
MGGKMRVLIFGFGVHGGGYAAAEYFLSRGHDVCITDLRSREELGYELETLASKGSRLVLGEHRPDDVAWADLVVKNPAVPASHPLLLKAKNIMNDMAWLLSNPKIDEVKIIAITGTKGKTTTASAIAHVLESMGKETQLCGNMGISGFTVADDWERRQAKAAHLPSYLVCEFSSWQIHDWFVAMAHHKIPRFTTAVLTSFFPDHLNRYTGLESYRKDKMHLFGPHCDIMLVPETIRKTFMREVSVPAKNVKSIEKLSATAQGTIPTSLHAAFATCRAMGFPPSLILEALKNFKGVPHRQEYVCTVASVMFINDSAATIPEAVVFSCSSFASLPIHLVCGGTDKNLEAHSLAEPFRQAASITLLDGSFTREKIIPLLREMNLEFSGPFQTMHEAVTVAWEKTVDRLGHTRNQVVMLSPGAASFELFKHEFDRGDQFCREVQELRKKEITSENEQSSDRPSTH